MSTTVVDRLHAEYSDLLRLLEESGEISLRSTADDNFRKSLLLCAASYFEHQITEDVLNYVREVSNSNSLITFFVHNKAIVRKYHEWFDWNERNANQFFGLFGNDFRIYMKDLVKQKEELQESIIAFLELGRERNRLVHQNYGNFTIEKTSEEIKNLFHRAILFVGTIPIALRDFTKKTSAPIINPPPQIP
jgi:hypothetical protein